MEKKLRNTLIWVLVLAALLVGALFAAQKFRPATSTGIKDIDVTIVHKDGNTNDFLIESDEEYLRGALENVELIAGEESEYGLYILTVDGETADESNQEWWCITKGGEMINYGVDEQPIADGEAYEITLMTGWD